MGRYGGGVGVCVFLERLSFFPFFLLISSCFFPLSFLVSFISSISSFVFFFFQFFFYFSCFFLSFLSFLSSFYF